MFTAESVGSISGQGTKIRQALQHSQNKKKRDSKTWGDLHVASARP